MQIYTCVMHTCEKSCVTCVRKLSLDSYLWWTCRDQHAEEIRFPLISEHTGTFLHWFHKKKTHCKYTVLRVWHSCAYWPGQAASFKAFGALTAPTLLSRELHPPPPLPVRMLLGAFPIINQVIYWMLFLSLMWCQFWLLVFFWGDLFLTCLLTTERVVCCRDFCFHSMQAF